MKRTVENKRGPNAVADALTILMLAVLTTFEIWHIANRTFELQHVGSVAYTNGWATLADVIAIALVVCIVAFIVFANHEYKLRSMNSLLSNRIILTLLVIISLGLALTGVVATNKAKTHAGLCATLTAAQNSYYAETYNCPGANK